MGLFDESFNIKLGLNKIPLTRANLDACFSPLSHERSAFVYTPYGLDATKNSRDLGLVASGNFFDDHLKYWAAIMEGREGASDFYNPFADVDFTSTAEPESNLEYVLRLHYSFLDPENSPYAMGRRVKRLLKKGSNARKRKLSMVEYRNLVAASLKHLGNILIVAMNTGMRLGEIRQLQWKHIDNGLIRLQAKDTKEKRPKVIPVNKTVQNVLNSVLRHINHDYVFTYKGNPIKDPGGLKRSFATACKNSSIPCGRKTENGITFHDIRTTVKINMLIAGVGKSHRDVILGHTLEGMDIHYIALEDEDLKKAMDIYSGWLNKELKNVDQTVDQNKKALNPK